MQNRSQSSRRHQVFDGSHLLGFVDYHLFGEMVILVHTETNPALAGKGHGKALAERVVAHFRQEAKKIVPVCSFFAHFLRTHPQHHDMLTPETRRIVESIPAIKMRDEQASTWDRRIR